MWCHIEPVEMFLKHKRQSIKIGYVMIWWLDNELIIIVTSQSKWILLDEIGIKKEKSKLYLT